MDWVGVARKTLPCNIDDISDIAIAITMRCNGSNCDQKIIQRRGQDEP